MKYTAVILSVLVLASLSNAGQFHIKTPENLQPDDQLFLAAPAGPAYQLDIAFPELQDLLGDAIPTGISVNVLQAEAGVEVDHDNDPETPPVPAWMPDSQDMEFSGKTITDMSGSEPGAFSGHATSVGRLFYGSASSMAPGVSDIKSYNAAHWLMDGYLHAMSDDQMPAPSHNRIFNNSWIGYTDNSTINSDVLRRVDWLIATDEALIVTAMGNGTTNQPFLGSAFNVVTVGRSDTYHAQGSVAVDDIYVGNRARPDIVAPGHYTSSATPMVASTLAMLVDKAHNSPTLSNDPAANYTTNRLSDVIYNAERTEVLKAALMAGASKRARNITTSNILYYRKQPENRTTNGLDSRFGAGQLNVYNTFLIIDSGEQNCQEDDPAGLGVIQSSGFDYNTGLNSETGATGEATYFFNCSKDFQKISASLVWNIQINGERDGYFDGNATLPDLALYLYDVTSQPPVMVAASNSQIDNTENFWANLKKGRSYMIKVVLLTPGSSDYGLAWYVEDFLEGDFTDDEDADGTDLSWFCTYFASQDLRADLNYDGIVDQADLRIFSTEFGHDIAN